MFVLLSNDVIYEGGGKNKRNWSTLAWVFPSFKVNSMFISNIVLTFLPALRKCHSLAIHLNAHVHRKKFLTELNENCQRYSSVKGSKKVSYFSQPLNPPRVFEYLIRIKIWTNFFHLSSNKILCGLPNYKTQSFIIILLERWVN